MKNKRPQMPHDRNHKGRCVVWNDDYMKGDDLQHLYERVLPCLRKIARQSGYALAVHGSMRRDFDLIAVPWRKKHVKPNTLAKRIMIHCTGFGQKFDWKKMPCGRIACTFPISMQAIVDLSVTPH